LLILFSFFNQTENAKEDVMYVELSHKSYLDILNESQKRSLQKVDSTTHTESYVTFQEASALEVHSAPTKVYTGKIVAEPG
jgi:hypothetical protein